MNVANFFEEQMGDFFKLLDFNEQHCRLPTHSVL